MGVGMNKGKIMKLEEKLIQNVRINPQRALILRDKVKDIESKTGSRIKESDIVNFLIDEGINRITIGTNELKII